MIKLDYTTVKNKDYDYNVKCSGCITGKHDEIVAEMCAVLDSFEDKFPDLFAEALDSFLKRRGF